MTTELLANSTPERKRNDGTDITVPLLRLLRDAEALAGMLLVLAGMTGTLLLLAVRAGRGWLLFSLLLTIAGGAWFGIGLVRNLLRPVTHLQNKVTRACQGDSVSRPPPRHMGALAGIAEDVDSMDAELTELYEEMDLRVARHTTRLAQKTASLKILYEVAASINQLQDLDELLLRFLRILKEMVNGLAATVRVARPDGGLRLVGSIGLDDHLLAEHEMLPLELCLCGTALTPGDVLCEHNERHCLRRTGRVMFGSDEVDLVSVPLAYQDELLGVYSIFVRKPGLTQREDILDLLRTIGSHLGMAIAKQRSDQEAMRLSLVEERTALAHELHDSLAQTLASLRYQVRLLQDSMENGVACETARTDMGRIREGLDEAHRELRELLSGYRASAAEGGLSSGLRRLVSRFSEETGITAYFQGDCPKSRFSSFQEMQVLRIVQESLANIRKHAKAHTVRVLLSCSPAGALRVLVEDDGVGFEDSNRIGRPGEHIGLSIMEERAKKFGATLRIDSEPGEGTRVELILPAQGDKEARSTL